MIELNETQCRSLQQGEMVRVSVPEVGAECVVLRADVFDRQQMEFDDDPSMRAVAALIEKNMREDDADDPLLESYQDL